MPVIASGGVGTLEHLRAGLVEGGADAALAASIFHDGVHTIAEAEGVPRGARGARAVRPARARDGGGRREMNATQSGCVTLDEVFAAAAARAASLVPETSGYLALAVGDATSRLPFAIEDRSVMLTTEGNVGITKRGELLPPGQAARGLREALARLLAVSTGTAMPGLSSAARPREESDRGVEAVVEEIEAALIPVNRARRAPGAGASRARDHQGEGARAAQAAADDGAAARRGAEDRRGLAQGPRAARRAHRVSKLHARAASRCACGPGVCRAAGGGRRRSGCPLRDLPR